MGLGKGGDEFVMEVFRERKRLRGDASWRGIMEFRKREEERRKRKRKELILTMVNSSESMQRCPTPRMTRV